MKKIFTNKKKLSKAIELLEKGKTLKEVCSLFPKQKDEICSMTEIMNSLKEELGEERITPSKEALENVFRKLEEIEKDVTLSKSNRYTKHRQRDGGRYIPCFGSLRSTSWWKITSLSVSVVGIVVFFVVWNFFGFWQNNQKQAQLAKEIKEERAISFEIENDLNKLESEELEIDSMIDNLEQLTF